MKNIVRSIRISAFPIAGIALVACAPLFGDDNVPATQGPHAVKADLRPSIGYYENAVSAINNRHYGLALDYLQAARNQKPDDVRVLTAFGVVYDKLGRFDLSAHYYAQASLLDPKSRIIAADMDYSRKLQGALTPDIAPTIAAAGSGATGGAAQQSALDSGNAVVSPTVVAQNPSALHPLAAISQIAVSGKEPVQTVPTAAIAKTVSPDGQLLATAPPPLAGPGTVAASAVTGQSANNLGNQMPGSQVVINRMDPVQVKVVTPPADVRQVAMAVATGPAPHIVPGTMPQTVAGSPKVEAAVAPARQNARGPLKQVPNSQVAVNSKEPVQAKVVTPPADVRQGATAVASGPAPHIVPGTMPRTVAGSPKVLAAVAPARQNARGPLKQIPNSQVAVNSKEPVQAEVVTSPADVRQVAMAVASGPGPHIAGGTTPRTVAGSPKVLAVVAPASQNSRGSHKQVPISQIAVNSKEPVRAKDGSPAAKVIFLTGHPLAIVDASGRTGADKSVRQYLSGLGWSVAKGDSLKTQIRPETAILYKEGMATAAKALARTLSLSLPMHITSRDDVEGLKLILGRDISGETDAGKLLQAQHRQLALASAKPKL